MSNQLQDLLLANDIEAGSVASYQVCKAIYNYHPLGAKIVSSSVYNAFANGRTVSFVDINDSQLVDDYNNLFFSLDCQRVINQAIILSRVYGSSAIYVGHKGKDLSLPLEIHPDDDIYFNVLDPLTFNAYNSDSLNQLSDNYLRHGDNITIAGSVVHPSRLLFINNRNEMPTYGEFSASSFGFNGRSDYQRCLVLLRTYIRVLQADEFIIDKAGSVIAKIDAGNAGFSNISSAITKAYRSMIQQLRGSPESSAKGRYSGGVITIGHDDTIETLNLQNINETVEGVRKRLLNDIASCCNMPASIMSDEAMAQGFSDGKEDALKEARYLKSVQNNAIFIYDWLDGILIKQLLNDSIVHRTKKTAKMSGNLAAVSAKIRNGIGYVFVDIISVDKEKEANITKVRTDTAIAINAIINNKEWLINELKLEI